jgi:aryl-alcohol dehydrogenase-like predicted oxidoreductase
VVATKIANPVGAGPNARGASRLHVMRAVEACLRRLRVEAIDVLYLHHEDHSTPMEETVRVIADLVHAGKLRHFGLSNHRSWRVAEFCRLSDAAGIDRPVVSQPLYNALNRTAETEELPACAHLGLGVFPYSPLARGVLTGKYAPGQPPAQGTRAGRQDKRLMETEWREESLRIAQELAARAQSRGITPGQFALAWVLNNRLVSGAIAGPRTIAQWDEYVGALEVRLDAEDEALVDRLVPPGFPSTPGYTDPAHPVKGRVARG